MWGINLKVDRGSVDSLVIARNPRCLRLNLPPYFMEVVISSPCLVQEFSKLGVLSNSLWCVGIIIRWFVGWYIDKLQDQWTAGDDARTTGQEITTNNVFEDRGFATRLGANYDLRNRI